jgi:hypothetical protein
MYIDINTSFTFEVSKIDDQSILAAIVPPHSVQELVENKSKQINIKNTLLTPQSYS